MEGTREGAAAVLVEEGAGGGREDTGGAQEGTEGAEADPGSSRDG